MGHVKQPFRKGTAPTTLERLCRLEPAELPPKGELFYPRAPNPLPRLPRKCEALSIQWPVGQGGFWTTSLEHLCSHGRRAVEIAFDCGNSSAPSALDRALKEYRPSHGRIDYLFISHLDSDHCSGVPSLLDEHEIDIVVLPLMDRATQLVLAAKLSRDARARGRLLELLLDPHRYLLERKVRRVFAIAPEIILPDESSDGIEGERTPKSPRSFVAGPSSPPQDVEATQGEHPQDLIARAKPVSTRLLAPLSDGVQRFESGLDIWLVGADGIPFWQLAPYVHRFESKRVSAFVRSVRRVLRDSNETSTEPSQCIQDLLRSKAGRRLLQRCYGRHVRSNHNSVSLSLFSCPRVSGLLSGSAHLAETGIDWKFASLRRMPNERYSAADELARWLPQLARKEALGTLHTGDSTLKAKCYREGWRHHYHDVLQDVRVFVAPHHGSGHNFHRELMLGMCPTITLTCAGRKNQFGHPARVVRNAAKRHRSEFHQVDEAWRSALIDNLSVTWR